MARPRMAQSERRTETLAIRLTPAERIRIEQAALAAGLSTSEYARSQLLTGRVVVRHNRTLDHAVFDELRRIGVNLNQLTRHAHIRGQLPDELAEVCATLDRLLIDALEEGAGNTGNGELSPERTSDGQGGAGSSLDR